MPCGKRIRFCNSSKNTQKGRRNPDRIASWIQKRSQHLWSTLLVAAVDREIYRVLKIALHLICRLSEGFWQYVERRTMACHEPSWVWKNIYTSTVGSLQRNFQCSKGRWRTQRLVSNSYRRPARMCLVAMLFCIFLKVVLARTLEIEKIGAVQRFCLPWRKDIRLS